jgi:hypothetical protein
MFKNWVNRIRSAFGQPKSADTIGDHCRAVDEYRADLARRGMVERPPNAERLVGGSVVAGAGFEPTTFGL